MNLASESKRATLALLPAIQNYKGNDERAQAIFDDIIGNSLSINDIDCKQCTVRIKSKGTFASSEWSDYFKISSSGDTSITTIVEDRNDNNCHFDINGYKTDRTKGLIIHKNGEKSVLKLIK